MPQQSAHLNNVVEMCQVKLEQWLRIVQEEGAMPHSFIGMPDLQSDSMRFEARKDGELAATFAIIGE